MGRHFSGVEACLSHILQDRYILYDSVRSMDKGKYMKRQIRLGGLKTTDAEAISQKPEL